MRIKKKLIYIPLLLLLTGCAEEVRVGPIEIPHSRSGETNEIMDNRYPVKTIVAEFQDRFEVKRSALDFEPRGVIQGMASPMIPLDRLGSHLKNLGFDTHITTNATGALLQYGDRFVTFEVGSDLLFVNHEPGMKFIDKPYYHNSTIYIPLIPLLDAMVIAYEVEGDTIVIGGIYTDGTFKSEDVDS